MSEPFFAEIRMVGFNFAPRGWATCDGQILPINQNQALFSLLGTTYGGDGNTTFALPDLRSRVPVHPGQGITLGQKGGTETETLTVDQLPGHSHVMIAAGGPANSYAPAGSLPAKGNDLYRQPSGSNLVPMHDGLVGPAGGGNAHTNLQPFLTLTFVIALQGLFPSRN